MKLLLLLGVLGWLFYAACTAPPTRVSQTFLLYVAAQLAFVLVCWISLSFPPAVHAEREYAFVFYLWLAVTVIFSCALASQFNNIHPLWLGTVVLLLVPLAQAGITAVLAHYLRETYRGHVPLIFAPHLLLFGLMFTNGAITLLSLAAPLSDFELRIRSALGLVWLVQGAVGLAASIGFVRARAVWISLNDVVPLGIALIAFAALAWTLTFAQREGSRQSVMMFPFHASAISLVAERRAR